jgi:ATP-binding cassette subfamily B protein
MADTSIAKDKKSTVSGRDVLRFTWHYIRPVKGMVFFSSFLMLLSVVMDALLPIYTGQMIDALTVDANVAAAWTAFFYFSFFATMHHVLRIISLRFWNKFAVINLQSIVNDGLRKVQRFSSDWHANSFAGGTVRKITRGMWAFDTFEDTIMMGLLPAVTIMISMTIMLTLKLALVGAIAAVMILIYCAVSIWTTLKIAAPRYQESADADTKMGATLADIMTGNATVKSFAAEKREDEAFFNVSQNWHVKSLRAWQTGVNMDAVRSVLRMFMMCSMVAVTIMLWKSGTATPGDVVLVINSFFIIGGYLRDVGMHISHLQRAVSEMEDVISFWLRDEDVRDDPAAKPLVWSGQKRDDLVSFQNVGFKYPNTNKFIYQGLSVDICSGENLALVGPSGSGKSTFVKLLQRLYNIDEGRILIDGQDIGAVTLESLRQHVTLVPQDPVLFHRSLSENISYSRPGISQDDIIRAAQKAYAHDFIMTLPSGYDTLVGERGVKLSGGERQRVAIARAILSEAPILILDEATSSLDSISEDYIQKALQELMKGRTTITIAHRLSTIQKADRILVFDQGKIIEQGSHKALMANPHSRYKALYDMQALGLTDMEEAA